MSKVIKLMVYKNRRVFISFRENVPYITVKDSWNEEELEFPIDAKLLGNVEDYPYAIDIEVYSYDFMARRTYKFFYKTQNDAKDAISKFVIGSEFLDDEIIKKVEGPFEADCV